MLDAVEFPEKMDKEKYHQRREELQEKLVLLQQRCSLEGLPVVIVLEGWSSSGKGSRISDLVVDLDPRLFKVHTTEDPIGYENRLPFMSRFWSRIGAHGTMTIFDQAWYEAAARTIVDVYDKSRLTLKDLTKLGEAAHMDKSSPLSKDQKPSANSKNVDQLASNRIYEHISSIRSIEDQLVADGYLLVKFFLHISEETQRERFVKLMLDPKTSFRVDEEDIRQVQRYDEYYQVFDRLLEQTDSPDKPWNIIPANERRYTNIKILEVLVENITKALEAKKVIDAQRKLDLAEKNVAIERASHELKHAEGKKETAKAQRKLVTAKIGDASELKSNFKLIKVKSLDDVSYDNTLSDDDYKEQRDKEQERLNELQMILYKLKIPMVIAYEGWDAAGKGGNIKRVARALDARSYVVHPISAPSTVELAHPFLWRFWTKLPRTGHIAIFDRTWYGRVMVERVEGFAREDEWKRAFDEINEFESELERWGAILIKFWIDVSSDEQLNRFKERQEDPAKQWKITDEDWRNREKNDLYRVCVNDMFRLTSTEYAPWHIIESDDKHFARVKALKIINKTIEERLSTVFKTV